MQSSPLLEKLDWIFTSPRWTTVFPNTMATPMAHIGSDHLPILIEVGTYIPKSNISDLRIFGLNLKDLMRLYLNIGAIMAYTGIQLKISLQDSSH
jgi:hypothetical protein